MSETRDIASLEQELFELKEERDALARQHELQRERGEKLAHELAELRRQAEERPIVEGPSEAVAEISGLRLRVEELETQHEFDRRRIEVLGRERGSLRETLAALRARVAELEVVQAESEALRDGLLRLEARTAELEQERGRLEQEHGQLQHERGQLEEQLSERDTELREAAAERERQLRQSEEDRQRAQALQKELEALRIHTEELRSTITAEQHDRHELLLRVERQRAEQRVLIRHLTRTEGAMQARTDQLRNVFSSRWYRLARSSWQLRRRRPPLGALGLLAIAIVGAVAAIVLAATIGTAVAGVLGAALVALVALAYAVVVPALRDKREPRMAGSGALADLLPDEQATLEELRALEPAAVDGPETTATAPPAPPAQAQPLQPPRLVTRLVPATPSAAGSDRDQWLAASRTVELRQLHVAGVLDDMSRACFDPECRLNCDFTMTDWRERLEAIPPHLLLVESAWSGNRGGWQYGVASYPHPDYRGLPQLRALIEWCREREIPTAFWNKEDPVHFERFREAAALFDHIFTSDANCIPLYEQLAGEHVKSVTSLQFAAQPRIHNPIPIIEERRLEPVFAGTYYRNRHADRRASLEMILDAARPFGLIIYDRTYGTASDEYGFPERFLPHIKGRLPYDQIVSAYKRHRVFLNVNSVTDSPTMFSRRVFELLACGTAVLSTDSAAMQTLFGDLVPVVESVDDATDKLERLLHDDAYYEDLTARASRLVLSEHTYRERLGQVARTAGFDLSPRAGEEIAAAVLVDSPDDLQLIESGFLAQSRAPDEILVGLRDQAMVGQGLDRLTDEFGVARVRTVVQEQAGDRRERWRELAALAGGPWVAPWQRPGGYGEHHLRDLGAASRFAEADVIGFPVAGGVSERYAEAVDSARALARRELVAERGWAESPEAQRRWFDQGVRFYATPGAVAGAPSDGSSSAERSTERLGGRRRPQRR
jgi:spore maturation protein CgeB